MTTRSSPKRRSYTTLSLGDQGTSASCYLVHDARHLCQIWSQKQVKGKVLGSPQMLTQWTVIWGQNKHWTMLVQGIVSQIVPIITSRSSSMVVFRKSFHSVHNRHLQWTLGAVPEPVPLISYPLWSMHPNVVWPVHFMKTPIGNGKRNAVEKLKEVSEIRIYVRLIVGYVKLTPQRR